MSFEARLKELGYTLEPIALDAGKIMRAVRTGSLVYTSGQVSEWQGREIKGRLGDTLDVDAGYEAARMATLNCLRAIHSAVGSIDRVTRVVKVLGLVNVAPGFTNTPAVIHGCSDLLLELFGEAGKHARSAIGVTVPLDYAVEIELIVEVEA